MKMTATESGITRRVVLTFLIGLASLSVGGCDKDDDNVAGEKLSPSQQVALGWTYFEDGDYTLALQEFDAAIAGDAALSDAWNGRGWALGKLRGRLSEAPACFARALNIDTTRYDAIGGWAFAVFQLDDIPGNYQSAINKSDSLLHRRPGWRFLHEPTLNEVDVYLLIAASHFNLGAYSASYTTIVDHLNPSFEADITTPAGRSQLLEEIERLRRING